MTLKALRLSQLPDPAPNMASLHVSAMATKNTIDALTGAVGPKEQRAVTFVDLVNLGLITEDQIPPKYE